MASMLTAGERSRQRIRESGSSKRFLFAGRRLSVAVTVAIVVRAGVRVLELLSARSALDFLTDTVWTPLFADPRYGILPLLTGTLLSTLVALCVAGPLGLMAAIYLSEFASPRTREILKPILELLVRRSDRRLRLFRAAVRDAAPANDHPRPAGVQHPLAPASSWGS